MITSKIFMWNVDKGSKTFIEAFFQKILRGWGVKESYSGNQEMSSILYLNNQLNGFCHLMS